MRSRQSIKIPVNESITMKQTILTQVPLQVVNKPDFSVRCSGFNSHQGEIFK